MYRPYIRFLLLMLAAVGLFAACERPENFQTGGSVDLWPTDTVKFDTLFTTLPSPTERVYLTNTTGKPLRIGRIAVRSGESSPFRLIVDGIESQEHRDIEIAKGDSLIFFLTVLTDTRDGDHTLTDDLVIDLDNGTTSRLIFAHVLDAYLLKGGTLDTVRTLGCDTTFTNDKPIVIDGPVSVKEGCTLTIEAGTSIFFTSARDNRFGFTSLIQVNGTLRVNEQGGDTVRFSSARLDKDYRKSAGQWQGIILSPKSRNNLIRRALIENGSIGVRVDSLTHSGEVNPKLTIYDTEIRNQSNFAILGVGASDYDPGAPPMIRGWNLMLHNTGQSVFGMAYGGNYELYHSTLFNSRQIGGPQSEPALGANNFLRNGGEVSTYTLRLILVNNLIWGAGEEEFALNIATGPRFEANISNNLLRSSQWNNDNLPGTGNLLNIDPLLGNARQRDFLLREGSPCIDAGLPLAQLPQLGIPGLSVDFAGLSRGDGKPDVGCLEYRP